MFFNRGTIVINTFQAGNEKNIVDRVARLVKICGNRSRADELIVGFCIERRCYPKRSLSWRLFSPICLLAEALFQEKNLC